jgi:hypothetical protein
MISRKVYAVLNVNFSDSVSQISVGTKGYTNFSQFHYKIESLAFIYYLFMVLIIHLHFQIVFVNSVFLLDEIIRKSTAFLFVTLTLKILNNRL